MVPITEAWIKDMLKAGEALNTMALRHNVDVLTIKCEPEFGYVHIEGSQTTARGDVITPVFKATQWRDFEATIEIQRNTGGKNMRTRIAKRGYIVSDDSSKVVNISVTKQNVTKSGKQNFTTVISFTGNSYKKINSTGYVALEVDDEKKRLYFVPAGSEDGYKLLKASAKTIMQLRVYTKAAGNELANMLGHYQLEYDDADNNYYIDYSK